MAFVGRGRIVAQRGVRQREVDRVESEAIDAAIEPEPRYIKLCLLHRRIAPVELRLCAREIVQIILPPPRVPAPGRAAEHRRPTVGRAAIRLGVAPQLPNWNLKSSG